MPSNSPQDSPPISAEGIRQGMWVVAEDGQVGIVNSIERDGVAEFHRVGVDGLTELVLRYHVSRLVQAKYKDIPEARRPNQGLARAYGYL